MNSRLPEFEALFAGATTEGERVAVCEVESRVQGGLGSAERLDDVTESMIADVIHAASPEAVEVAAARQRGADRRTRATS